MRWGLFCSVAAANTAVLASLVSLHINQRDQHLKDLLGSFWRTPLEPPLAWAIWWLFCKAVGAAFPKQVK